MPEAMSTREAIRRLVDLGLEVSDPRGQGGFVSRGSDGQYFHQTAWRATHWSQGWDEVVEGFLKAAFPKGDPDEASSSLETGGV
jgi:hypothetical protein